MPDKKTHRVLVLTAEEGEGHTSVARALETELTAEGSDVVVLDAFQGSFGRIVPFFSRDAYRLQLRWAAWSYGLEYLLFTRFPPARALARMGIALLGSRPLHRTIRRHKPDVVVSTHPAVTSALGHLRRTGKLKVPVVATITDFGAHPLWSHPGVDLHLVMHESCLRDVEKVAGPGSARVSRPLVSPHFRLPLSREQARRELELPETGPLVVVSGGGWGVGAVERAVEGALRIPDATVVCLAGRNEHLAERLRADFGSIGRVRVLGFTDRMNELLAGADALIDSTVGVTCLEAITRGCRILVHGAPPGHSRDNARAIAGIGLGEVASSPGELAAAIAAIGAASNGRADGLGRISAAALVLGAQPRRYAFETRRRRLLTAGAATTATLAFSGWTFASTGAYPLVERTLGLKGLKRVHTRAQVVGLVVQAPPSAVERFARELRRQNERASFGLADDVGAKVPAALRSLGEDVLPLLPVETPTQWLHARRVLRETARELGMHGHHVYFLPARAHITLAGYVVARSAGGVPVLGEVRLAPRNALPARLQAGEIVLLTLDSSPSSAVLLERLVARLHALRLRAVPVSELVASAARTAPTAGERATARTPASTAASAIAKTA